MQGLQEKKKHFYLYSFSSVLSTQTTRFQENIAICGPRTRRLCIQNKQNGTMDTETTERKLWLNLTNSALPCFSFSFQAIFSSSSSSSFLFFFLPHLPTFLRHSRHCLTQLLNHVHSCHFPIFSHTQPLWRFTDSPHDGRVLVYRSEDIKNLSRIVSPKVCGYVHAEPQQLLPENARNLWGLPEQGEFVCLCLFLCVCSFY